MPETSKQSSDWRTMDASFAIAIEALHTARILVRNSFESGLNDRARNLSTRPEAPQDAIYFSENARFYERFGYDPERQNISTAAQKLGDVCDALKSVSSAIEANALTPKNRLIVDRVIETGPAVNKTGGVWSKQKQKLIANVNPLPSANDNLLIIRGIANSLILKAKQFFRPGAECFTGQDRLDALIGRYGARILRLISRTCALPFLRFSPASALKFLRFWKRFWSNLIVSPGLSPADLQHEREDRSSTIRPSAVASLLTVAGTALSLLMPYSSGIDKAAPQYDEIVYVAADPIVTGAITRRALPVRVSTCSTRAWGRSCYRRRSRR